jgi:HD-like signal output (HDOD) protein
MQPEKCSGLEEWVEFLSQVEIPTLKYTARSLTALRADEENVSARGIAQIIKYDPLTTVKLLRYLHQNKNKSQQHEVMEVEQALMMLGMETALKCIPVHLLVEEQLSGQRMNALICLLQAIKRAKQASAYAYDWAVRLQDLHFEEIRIAALLHDIAELLMWCFAPTEMLRINAMQKQDKTLRSIHAQEKVFGFTLLHLQSELVIKWGLPKLLITLMDDNCAHHQRVSNVVLAVNLARHAANGWDNAALPDDYSSISKLLQMQTDDVKAIIGAKKTPNIMHQ